MHEKMFDQPKLKTDVNLKRFGGSIIKVTF